MEKKKNGENYVEIKNANPEVLKYDNKKEKKNLVIPKGIPLRVFEKSDIKYNIKHGVYEKIARAREEGKYVPNVGLSKDPNSWQKRDKDWEFEDICDFEYGFTDEEKFCDLIKTDYVRFQMTIIVEDYLYSKTRYFSGDTILGAAINCIVKKPISNYVIRNRKNYIFDIHVLNQTFQTLYEKGIEFDCITATYKTFCDSIFIYFGCSVLKDIQDLPKKYDVNEDLEDGFHIEDYRNYLIKPENYTSKIKETPDST